MFAFIYKIHDIYIYTLPFLKLNPFLIV